MKLHLATEFRRVVRGVISSYEKGTSIQSFGKDWGELINRGEGYNANDLIYSPIVFLEPQEEFVSMVLFFPLTYLPTNLPKLRR